MSCQRQYTKKYTARKSPPYPANECCGMYILGNDGDMYLSVRAKNGVCRWSKPKKSVRASRGSALHVDPVADIVKGMSRLSINGGGGKPKKSAAKPATRKSKKTAAKKTPAKRKDNMFHVTVKMKSQPSHTYRQMMGHELADHLRRYFDPEEISQLVDYNHPEYMKNLRLDGVYLHFDVPKTVFRHFGWMKNKAQLHRHIMTPALADGSWEGGSSNFFILRADDQDGEEIALISPGEVTIV